MILRISLCLAAAAVSCWSFRAVHRQPPLADPGANDNLTLIANRQGQITPAVRSSLEAPWTKGDIQSVGIDNTLNAFHEAAAKADFDAYFAAWTDDSVFLGTDATERWVGDQFKDFARPIFAKGKGWTYHPSHRTITILPDHTTAFFDELLDNEKLGLCRGSGVLVKRGEDWKILQYNLSIPVPNDLASSVVDVIRKETPAAPAVPPSHPEKK